MTTQEAIKTLKDVKLGLDCSEFSFYADEALDMAIEALSDDCQGILTPEERSEVLNTIDDALNGYQVDGYEDTDGMFFKVLISKKQNESELDNNSTKVDNENVELVRKQDVIKMIQETNISSGMTKARLLMKAQDLPSAQEKHSCDMISRSDAIKVVSEHSFYDDYDNFDELTLIKKLEDLPSAQPDKDMLHLQREQAYMQGWEDACKSIRLANIPSPHKEQKGLHSSTVSRIYDRGWQDGQNALREERNDKTGSD